MPEPTNEELAAMPEFLLSYMAPMWGPGRPYGEELIRRRNAAKEIQLEKEKAMQTKTNFLKVLKEELSAYEWSKDEARMARAMDAAEKTLNGTTSCAIDGPSWKSTWKEIGMKGRLTYKALHALPA